MTNFPDWSDLGTSTSEQLPQDWWSIRLSDIEKYRYYFSGDIFGETIDGEYDNFTDKPLLYPIGLNLVRSVALTLADTAFGEWEERPLSWSTRQEEEISEVDAEAIKILTRITDESSAPSTLWELELDRLVYGGGAMKIHFSPKPPFITWRRLLPDQFYPIFDPEDPNELLEVYLVVAMDHRQAKLKYGYEQTARDQMVQRIEHWTKDDYETYLDGKKIGAYSGRNPWKLIPFVYVPRFRTDNWWGECLTKEIIPIQDELNARIADIAEAMNYNAHPVRWGVNLPSNFNARNFPLEPNAMWDLGRSLPNGEEPKVGMLEANHAISPGTFDYIEFIVDWTRTASQTPPIAFGVDDGGGQRSGATLEIRMWPLIRATIRSRGYLGDGLRRAADITAKILLQKKLPKISEAALKNISDGNIVPRFYEIMPRDQAALVDEVLKLLSTDPPSISIETAVTLLGRGPGELARIVNMMGNEALWKSRVNKPGEESVENKGEKDKGKENIKEDSEKEKPE